MFLVLDLRVSKNFRRGWEEDSSKGRNMKNNHAGLECGIGKTVRNKNKLLYVV